MPEPEPGPESLWPYVVSQHEVRVRRDGTVVIPAWPVSLLGVGERDTVTVSTMSDGHLEFDSPEGRLTLRPSGMAAINEEDFTDALRDESTGR